MRFEIKSVIPRLRPHQFFSRSIIVSDGYKILKRTNNNTYYELGTIPNEIISKILIKNRLISRGLRLGISQIKKIFDTKILIFSNRYLILTNEKFSDFQRVDIPSRSFQLLDHNICYSGRFVYFGEYFSNIRREKVFIYQSEDGLNWRVALTFPIKSIRHVHSIQYDPFEKKIWFSTGDFRDEVIIAKSNYDFSSIEEIGRGTQRYRTLEFLFSEKYVYWGMDSEIEDNYLVRFDRKKKDVKLMKKFDGPIYNLKKTNRGLYIITTSAESGCGDLDNKAHLWVSKDLETWSDLLSFQKDDLPDIFGHGRLLLPSNLDNEIIFSGQGLKEIENKMVIGKIL